MEHFEMNGDDQHGYYKSTVIREQEEEYYDVVEEKIYYPNELMEEAHGAVWIEHQEMENYAIPNQEVNYHDGRMEPVPEDVWVQERDMEDPANAVDPTENPIQFDLDNLSPREQWLVEHLARKEQQLAQKDITIKNFDEIIQDLEAKLESANNQIQRLSSNRPYDAALEKLREPQTASMGTIVSPIRNLHRINKMKQTRPKRKAVSIRKRSQGDVASLSMMQVSSSSFDTLFSEDQIPEVETEVIIDAEDCFGSF